MVKATQTNTNKIYRDIRYGFSGSSRRSAREIGKGIRQDKEGNKSCDRTTKIKVLSGRRERNGGRLDGWIDVVLVQVLSVSSRGEKEEGKDGDPRLKRGKLLVVKNRLPKSMTESWSPRGRFFLLQRAMQG